ncbi:unnamed protein product [Lepidochelys kempii]
MLWTRTQAQSDLETCPNNQLSRKVPRTSDSLPSPTRCAPLGPANASPAGPLSLARPRSSPAPTGARPHRPPKRPAPPALPGSGAPAAASPQWPGAGARRPGRERPREPEPSAPGRGRGEEEAPGEISIQGLCASGTCRHNAH